MSKRGQNQAKVALKVSLKLALKDSLPATRAVLFSRGFSAMFLIVVLSGVLSVLAVPETALAWGKRGHEIVNSTAGTLVASEAGGEFLKEHTFDLGYFGNVPDIVWRRAPNTAQEGPEHYMDMEIFIGELGKEQPEAFKLSRAAFEAKYAKIDRKAGRAWWRIQELVEDLEKSSKKLRDEKLEKAEKHKFQAEWLMLAGVIGHYIGDLSQPLHGTENHDGEKTEQKGIHWYYENGVVNELYPELGLDVQTKARAQWAEFKSKHGKDSIGDLVALLLESGKKDLEPLLKIDKRVGRKEIAKAAAEYKSMITSQLVLSSLALAEIYRRNVGWAYNSDKFYDFLNEPEYIDSRKHAP